MRAKTLLTVLFLISVGIIAAVLLRALPSKLKAAAAPRQEILVATVPLAQATLLRSEDVGWRLASGSAAPGEIVRPSLAQRRQQPALEEAIRDQVLGSALRSAVKSGEPILASDIVKPGQRGFLRLVLRPGERAIAIPVTTGGASTGLLTPGDYVDVILTQRFGDVQMARRSVAETIVRDLRVLVVSPSKGRNGVNAFGATVTLEVTPQQAEKINVATELGKLSLTLRPSENSIASASQDSAATPVKAIWAGDVSPVLGDVRPPQRVIADPPPIVVIRGAGAVAEKQQQR